MKDFTQEETNKLNDLTSNYKNNMLNDIPPLDLNKIIALKIRYESNSLFTWMEEVDVILHLDIEKSNLEFKGHKVIFNANKYSTLSNVIWKIYQLIEDMNDECKKGKHPSNTVPYALEFLFENKSPHRNIEIKSHFQEGNFVLVKTISEKRTEGKKRSSYKDIEHEFVIEKWHKDGEVMFKTKAKDFFVELKSLKEAKTAPKVDLIEIDVKYKEVSSYTEFKPIVEVKTKDGKAVLEILIQCTFDKKFLLTDIVTHQIVYNDGKYAQIDFAKDEYTYSSNAVFHKRKSLLSKYFTINEFGGLQEVDRLPIAIDLQLPEQAVLPDPEVVPFKLEDIQIRISEDEHEILGLPYTYFDVEVENESYRAKIYKITNKFNEASFYQYLAKYDDCWVNTNRLNPKIQELFEVLEFCDILTKDWTELPVQGG